jgi:hypothetical protein
MMKEDRNSFVKFESIAVFVLLISASVTACKSTEVIDRPIDPMVETPVVHGPAIDPPRQDVYLRERRPLIKELQRDPDGNGSLFPIDDPGANLFVRSPLRPGMVLDVDVVPARGATGSDKKKDGGGKSEVGETSPADALVAAIPKLEPLESGNAPVKSFKARLETILPGGEGVISVSRSSARDGEFREFHAKALVPAERLIPGARLSTADLYDVAWSDYDGSQVTERRSTAWEDEYTLRLSGFEELRSKEAKAVEEGRRQVELAREKIGEESRKISEERARSAKQRDDLMQKLRDTEAKVAELQKNAPPPAKAADVKASDKPAEAKTDANKGGSADGSKK